jgi:hypothetical protein
MSDNIPVPEYDSNHIPEYKSFAYIVDGEIAWFQKVDVRVEQAVAVMSSNPTVVVIPEQLASNVDYTWSYDGVNFNPPA